MLPRFSLMMPCSFSEVMLLPAQSSSAYRHLITQFTSSRSSLTLSWWIYSLGQRSPLSIFQETFFPLAFREHCVLPVSSCLSPPSLRHVFPLQVNSHGLTIESVSTFPGRFTHFLTCRPVYRKLFSSFRSIIYLVS